MLQLVAAERSAAAALEELNRKLHEDLARREFVALLLLRFDPESGEVELANAGLPDPILLAPGRPPAPLEVPGPRLPLGVRPLVGYRSLRFAFAPAERLLLYTDGLVEARDERDEPYGYERLTAALAAPSLGAGATHPGELRPFLDAVVGLVTPSGGRPLEDDCTVVVLERLAATDGSVLPRARGAR
jgi:serine phosphatase RsbU (regulator of sigma subunit)